VLEDHVAALSFGDSLDLGDLFDEGNREAQKRIEWALNQLRRNAAGETTLMKEMRELDNRLGAESEGDGGAALVGGEGQREGCGRWRRWRRCRSRTRRADAAVEFQTLGPIVTAWIEDNCVIPDGEACRRAVLLTGR
jgi:hypothetical protein